MRPMRGGPYRTPDRGGCEHRRERPGSCDLCGKPCCSDCAEGGVCSLCLFKAFQAIKWKEGLRRGSAPVSFGRVSLLLAAGLWITTAAAVHAVTPTRGSISTVEVANPVLTGAPRDLSPQEASPKSAPRPAPPGSAAEDDASVDPSLLASPRILDEAGPGEHDPRALLAEAERLSAAGVDVTILRASVSRAVSWGAMEAEGAPAHVRPIHDAGGRVAGARISGFSADSFPVLAGLANGDVITAINGFAISSPVLADVAYQASRRAGMAVAEVLRGHRRVVVAVSWPSDRP